MRTKVSHWGLGCPRVSNNETCDPKQLQAGCNDKLLQQAAEG